MTTNTLATPTQTNHTKKALTGPTHFIYVLDKSGSMSSLANKVIANFNAMVSQQAKIDDGSFLTLYLFNTEQTKIYDRVPLGTVAALNSNTYRAEGGTSLLDAVGNAILENTGHDKTYLCVFTDGEENSSYYFNKEVISLLIDQREEEGWDINYIGSSLKGFHEAGRYGFKSHKTAHVQNTASGLDNAYGTMASTAAKYRETGIN